jgi:hypothetical protein
MAFRLSALRRRRLQRKQEFQDLIYRYINYGSITDTVDCAGGWNSDSFNFDKLYSNDIMLGLRWTCCELPPPPLLPLRSRG